MCVVCMFIGALVFTLVFGQVCSVNVRHLKRHVCVWSFDTNGVLIPGGMCVWSFDAIGFPIPGGMCVRARVAFRPLPVFDELVLCNDEDGWGVEIPTRKCLPSV